MGYKGKRSISVVFKGFKWVLHGCTGFYWVLLFFFIDFIGFQWVPMGFELVFKGILLIFRGYCPDVKVPFFYCGRWVSSFFIILILIFFFCLVSDCLDWWDWFDHVICTA